MPARSQPPRAAALRGEAARTGRTPADRSESLSPDHGATHGSFPPPIPPEFTLAPAASVQQASDCSVSATASSPEAGRVVISDQQSFLETSCRLGRSSQSPAPTQQLVSPTFCSSHVSSFSARELPPAPSSLVASPTSRPLPGPRQPGRINAPQTQPAPTERSGINIHSCSAQCTAPASAFESSGLSCQSASTSMQLPSFSCCGSSSLSPGRLGLLANAPCCSCSTPDISAGATFFANTALPIHPPALPAHACFSWGPPAPSHAAVAVQGC